MKNLLRVICLGFCTIFLASCLQPLESELLTRLKDDVIPVLEILLPEDRTEYRESVTVTGRITGEANVSETISSLTFSVSNSVQTLIEESPVSLGGSGGFDFSFETVGFSGDVRVTVRVTDWNENSSEREIVLEDPGTVLPSFRVSSGNRSAQVSWTGISDAQRYLLRYTTDGALPTAVYGIEQEIAGGDQNEIEITIPDLENGSAHVFQLISEMSDGSSLISDYRSALPLSPLTLIPRIEAGYRQIYLEWTDIPGAPEYEVWRSVGNEDNYTKYTEVGDSHFLDEGVFEGADYFYMIRPVFEGAILSGSAWGTPDVFPAEAGSFDQIAGYPLGGQLVHIEESEGILAGVLSEGEIVLMDVNRPDSLQELSRISFPDVHDIKIRSNNLFVISENSAISSYDIADPAAPLFLASMNIDPAIDPSGCEINDWYLFILDTGGVVHFIDIRNPAAPVYHDSLTPEAPSGTTSQAISIAVPNATTDPQYTFFHAGLFGQDDTTFDSRGHVLICYVYHPDDPRAPGYTTNTSVIVDGDFPDRLAYSDDDQYLFATASAAAITELPFFDFLVIDPLSVGPAIIGQTPGHVDGSPSNPRAYGNTVYIKDGWGYVTVDITDPANPAFVSGGGWDTPGPSRDLEVNSRSIFIASGPMGLQTVSNSALPALQVDGEITGINALATARKGSLLYVARGSTDDYSLASYDITDPVSPVLLHSVDLEITGTKFELFLTKAGNSLLVSDGGPVLRIVDISQPHSLAMTSSPEQGYGFARTEIRGEVLFTINNDGLTTFNIADPLNPVFLGFNDKQFSANDFAIKDNLLYIADAAYFRPSDLIIYNIEDPATPIKVGEISNMGAEIHDLYLQGDMMLLQDSFGPGGGTMYLRDVDPDSSSYLEGAGTPPDHYGIHYGIDIEAQGIYIFSINEEFDFEVLDHSAATKPVQDQALTWTDFDGIELRVHGGYAIIADKTNGVKIIKLVD